MFLKDHLKDSYQKASFDKNNLKIENIINRWVHRFDIESLNELIASNQDQIKLLEEDKLVSNQDQTRSELLEIVQNEIEVKFKSNKENKYKENKINNKDIYGCYKNKSEDNKLKELPLPKINNLRKWINNGKKAS
ncbi:possible glycoprotein [Prochlorococcus marinus str. MIT 9515]|uniref:Possible glycoprotein n=1 Tax=Prochlorococcus marinus (strain MIT 9515) TaxID=167542 RepID=A2BVB1_PROM5|nr:hypothetical protein [Prochlorococcus marinus]ABM71722.1 possible glycoprotein [Prochlorococcus marinus str. MIT 9515]